MVNFKAVVLFFRKLNNKIKKTGLRETCKNQKLFVCSEQNLSGRSYLSCSEEV